MSNPGKGDKRQGEQATSDKRPVTRLGRGHWPTSKDKRDGRGVGTIGAKENPAGVNLRGLVGVPMSIAREGGENQEEGEEEAEG